jgi:hypothetical protein
VNRLGIVLDDGVLLIAPDFAEKVITRLDMGQVVERFTCGRIRRPVRLLVDVNTDFVVVLFHSHLRWLQTALIQGQQVVVPVAVSIRAKVRCAACRSDNADIRTLPGVWINDKKRVGTGLDASNDILAGPLLSRLGIAQMGDVFVRAMQIP